ncbi:ABC transporter ATP-binding protein [Serinicoccus kebangsaanensis]|uniref:ABC transporter ATP-binding protein n=1 Tax=Serinicoccus kebangsaanensis TaxID=2602069 RepID=UPI00124E7819|nr:ABC transporter ATP-binding protein [Serinicoccus kebangsaanensis]
MAARERGTPTVVASHLGLTYRVFGAGSGYREQDEHAWWQRAFGRSTRAVGVREVEAVKDLSFVARHGEAICLVGRNGSGKSTLLRTVAGLMPPTTGSLWIAGEPRLLGVNAVLMSKLTGARNVMIGCQALGMSAAQARAKFDDIVEFSGIGDFIDLPMNSYSSGMAARLRFAISTASVPDILVVDEALATGDAEFKARATERIAEIREQAGTVFLVAHNAATMKEIARRAMWMEKGELIMDGPVDEVVDAYSAKFGRKARAQRAAKAADEAADEAS